MTGGESTKQPAVAVKKGNDIYLLSFFFNKI